MANVTVPPFTEAPSTVVGGTPTSVFPFDFPFWSVNDILVYIDGVLLNDANYSVEGFFLQDGDTVEGGYGSGEVTLDTAVSDCTVTIDRFVVGDRQTQFNRSVPLGMPALNGDLNRVTARQQDLARLKVSKPTGDIGGKFLGFDAEGNPVVLTGVGGADEDLRTDLAASTGGSLLGFLAEGVGAVIRTILSKLRDRPTFEDYDCVGDGVVDDAANVRRAIAANSGKTIYGRKTYLLGSSLGDIPQGTKIVLENRTGTAKFIRGYSGGYLMNLLNGAELQGWVDGNGATYTGGLVNIPVGHGNQSIHNARLINAVGGTPLNIECTGATDAEVGGSRMDISNLEAYRSDSTPGSGRYAIVHGDPGVPAAGHPISIHHLETGGYESISFGACNNFSMTGCTIFDVLLSVNTRGLRATTNRWAGTSGITLRGASQFSACSFGPAITVESGAVAMFDPACLFNSTVTDNSGVAGVCHFWDAGTRTFTPDWEAGGANITQGATGLVQGFQRRRGDMLLLGGRIVVDGSGASVPSGAITMEAPMIADADWMAQPVFSGHVILASGLRHPIQGTIAGGQTEVSFRCADGSVLTDASFSTATPYSIVVRGEYLV